MMPFPDEGIAFDFVSDEFDGRNRGPGEEAPRKKVTAHFADFREAERLNAVSRIYPGIHWEFDADDVIVQGNELAKDVFEKFVKPMP